MNLRKKFTLWYIRKGYKFGYDNDIVCPKAIWTCPWYIKPLLFLFSPSVYVKMSNTGKSIVDGFLAGFSRNGKT